MTDRLNLSQLKANSPKELLAMAEDLEIENASTMRKGDMMFSILKERADWEREHGEFHYWLDYSREIVPPPFQDSLSFTPHNTALPSSGLWQMNFTFADIDEDGPAVCFYCQQFSDYLPGQCNIRQGRCRARAVPICRKPSRR